MPGYMFHLSEGQRILELLEQTYGFYLPRGWKNQFLLGCLIPDTARGMEKTESHYWDKDHLDILKRRPNVHTFDSRYHSYMEDPRVLGYRTHLELDIAYMNRIWDRHMTFVNEDGVEEELESKITAVLLDGVDRPVPVKEFLSSRWLYGDYSRMNETLIRDYGVPLPTYETEDWMDYPVEEIDREKIPALLEELEQLYGMKKEESMDGIRFLQYEWVRELLDTEAAAAALRIAEILRAFPQSGAVDLHTHTCCSDGSLTPTELVQLAMRRRLKAIALTDHDTMEGVAEALKAGERLGVRVIPGMEFSTKEEGHDVHMVGLFLDPENPELRRAMATIVQNRWRRNQEMAQKLIDADLGLTREMVDSLGTGIWTRANLAGLLIDLGVAESVQDGMKRYLSPGCIGYVPKVTVGPEEAVRLAHAAGGLVFVAHYYQIDKRSLENSYRICENILQAGADGLETLYCLYDEEMERQTEELAQRYDCLRSGGSDFHGRLKPGLELGYGYGKLAVPEHFLVRMEEALEAQRAQA